VDAPITGGLLFIGPLYDLAFNMLIVLYRLSGENLGIAIILFTLLLRLVTLPFSLRQVKSAKQSREFQEKYKAVQAKHKGSKDKEAMTKELAALQSEYLPAQLGGCLPLILQLLFFFQVYYVVTNSLRAGTEAFNAVAYSFVPKFAEGAVLDLSFLGMNLGQSASGIGFDNISAVAPYVILILLVGLTQFFSGRVMAGLSAVPKKGEADSGKTDKDGAKELSNTKSRKLAKKKDKSVSSKEENKSSKDKKGVKDGKDGKKTEDLSFSDAMQQSSQTMIYILPVMTMLISFSFPAGLSLYWTVNSGFAIIQQTIVHRKKIISGFKTRFNKLINNQPNHEGK
jgi:YidC/Oxa1 family membrane protein insertase